MVVVAESTAGKILGTPDPRRPGTGVVTDTAKLRPGGISILMSRPVLAEVAGPLNLPPTHDLLRDHHCLADEAMEVGVELIATVDGPTAGQCPQIEGIGESEGDAVQTTVIELEPIPAAIHHAHVLPEETETDGGLSPVA